MPNKKGQVVLGAVASILLLAFIVFVSIFKLSLPLIPLILIIAPVIFLITFINTDVALIILIFSMLLSPEIILAQLPGRDVVVRVDDILLIIIFFTWLAKTAIHKELGLFRRTPLSALIVAYIVACFVSTTLGVLAGRVHPLRSYFHIFKYIEYFMIYFLVANNLRDRKQIKTFLAAFLITCAIVCVFVIPQIGVLGRTTAPFDFERTEDLVQTRKAGEANTLGGVLNVAVCAMYWLSLI